MQQIIKESIFAGVASSHRLASTTKVGTI